MREKKYKILYLIVLLGILISAFYAGGFFTSWQNKFNDKLFLQGQEDKNIVIVAIGNESLQVIGRWPWDRSIHADLISKLSELNPLVIGLDVNFPEASDSESDAALANAIQSAGNIILPAEAELSRNRNGFTIKRLLSPFLKIGQMALERGVTNTPPDSDGIFRSIPLCIPDQSMEEHCSFAYYLAKFYLESKGIRDWGSPALDDNSLKINYVGRPGTFTFLPAHKILAGEYADVDMTGKIVLIGATAPDLHDEQITPVSAGRPMSGVEIHANAIATIINNHYLAPLGLWWQILLFVILALAVSLAVLLFRVRFGVLISAIISAIYITAALILFDSGLILDLFFALLAVFTAFTVTIIWRYVIEQKEKRHIKGTFSRYVSPEVISDLLENPEKLKLGGEKKELSIMFSDIRGFTTISEKLSPEQLVSLLNEYLSAMTDLIMDEGGVVDKYIGDAIMAFWGAPLEQPRHAELSCRAALDMIAELDKNREKWRKDFGVELKIGIGINTGEAIIGNMGSDKRFDYTLMGDSVNLASRLEGITKQYGVEIAVSEFTRRAAEDKFIFRYLDKVAVKGKLEGVKIYELMGRQEDKTDNINKLLADFSQGIGYYRAQEWDKAMSLFKAILDEFKDDGPSRVYLERCEELKASPPKKNWDGIFRLTTK
ncbi:MAG: adenylate/guanylate cyclase domain-containing protein [Patescibacteria group bacterium]|nr:adenylate/guanylate cyclase domain-containing protein [Patescibacteria group bacterium]